MKEQGNIAELKFMSEAMQRGIAVSLTFGDNQKYDCITDGSSLFRVQIKSTSRRERSCRLNAYNFLVCHGNRSKEKYTKKDCDILALYVIPEDVWYFLPIGHVTTKTIKVYPHVKNSKHKYERWRSAWDIF